MPNHKVEEHENKQQKVQKWYTPTVFRNTKLKQDLSTVSTVKTKKKAAPAVSDKVLPLSLSLRQPPNHASELQILTSPFYNLAFYFALMKRSKNSDVKLHKAM